MLFNFLYPTLLAAQQNPLITVGFAVVMLVVLYLVMILPQKRAEKKQKLERSQIKVGDAVVTIGGLVGKVVNIKDDDITITTSVAQTMVTYRRDAINVIKQPVAADNKKSAKK